MLSIIIPCYNEEKNLRELLSKIEILLAKFFNQKIEVILVDNGSTDKSCDILENNHLYNKDKIKLVKIKNNLGYGNGVIQGIRNSKGDYIAWLHADLQADPIDVVEIFNSKKARLEKEQCIVKGLRINRGLLDKIFTTGMSILTFFLFGEKISDVNAQPKIFTRSLIKIFDNAPNDFSLDLFFLLLAKKNNIRIYEHNVMWHKRYAGEAKGGGSFKLKLKLTMRTLKYMMELKKKNKWNL